MIRDGKRVRQLGAAGIAAAALGLGIFTGAQAALYTGRSDISGQWEVQVMESTTSGRVVAADSFALNISRFTVEKISRRGAENGSVVRLNDDLVELSGPLTGTYRISRLGPNAIVLDGDTADESLYLVRK